MVIGVASSFLFNKPVRRIYETPGFHATEILGEQIKILERCLTSLPPHNRGQHSSFKFKWRVTLEAFKQVGRLTGPLAG
jgi:hypothetical protein